MKIRFRKKTQSEWLVLYILIMSLALPALQEFLRVPSLIKYTLDIAWLILLILLVKNTKLLSSKTILKLLWVPILFVVASMFGQLLNYQSLLYYFWGIRNNVRYYIFFFACILCLKRKGVEQVFHIFDALFWVNMVAVLLQIFVFGKTRDYVGGVFGVTKGCNSYMNVYLIIMSTKTILNYLHGRETINQCLVKCAVTLLIIILAEIKIFVFEFAIIIVFAILMTRFSYRKLFIVVGSIVGIYLAVILMMKMFPEFGNWMSLEGVIAIIGDERGYSNRFDLNRLTAIPVIYEQYLDGVLQKLFGLGLGNCDTATYAFLQTPFYLRYSSLHYTWFSSAFLFLETGIVGTMLYLLFYVVVFILAQKKEQQNNKNVFYCQYARIIAVLAVVIFGYNSSLRTEAGYLMYFAMALPFLRDCNVSHARKVEAI